LIGRGRADENVLLGFSPEKFNIPLYIIGVERDPVDNSVKPLPSQRFVNLRRLIDVAQDVLGARTLYLVLPTVEQIKVYAFVYCPYVLI
jgi:hypothetical protein